MKLNSIDNGSPKQLAGLSYTELDRKSILIFFNELFNDVPSIEVDGFLNDYYDKSSDKVKFLRKLGLDVEELFYTLEKPNRINEVDEPEIIVDMLPHFKPYGYDEYLSYERRFKEVQYWIKDKLMELEKGIQDPKTTKQETNYTVKSICIAYYYLYKNNIFPIPEIIQMGKLKQFFKKLEETYGLSSNSFRNEWTPLNFEENRLANPENIKLAIKLLETIKDDKIQEVIEYANRELNEAELKK